MSIVAFARAVLASWKAFTMASFHSTVLALLGKAVAVRSMNTVSNAFRTGCCVKEGPPSVYWV